jgi:hypothetical protein
LRYLIRLQHRLAPSGQASNASRCLSEEEAMKRQDEAHERSEDISDDVMNEVVKALRKRVRKVDHSYDIPYIAGYSKDARTIYIDRHLPRSFRSWTSRVYVTPFLLTHEMVEKALLDELDLHYVHAHQIGLRTERAAVEAAGISWRTYEGFMKKHEKAIEEEKLQRVPRDLDLTPYRDTKDFELLRNLVRGERRPNSRSRRTRAS